MSNMELVLNMLAETSSTEISKSTNSKGFDGAKQSVIKGGNIAKINCLLYLINIVELFLNFYI